MGARTGVSCNKYLKMQKQPWTGPSVEAERVLRYMLEKVKIAMKITSKGNSGEDSGRKKESWKESFHLFREHINNHEQNVGINMDD